MLSCKEVRQLHFSRPADALSYLNSRQTKRHLLQAQDLRVNEDGTLSYQSRVAELQDVLLTNHALDHLNQLAGITPNYSGKIEPKLHAHSINEQLQRYATPLTVVVETDPSRDMHYVMAVLTEGALGLKHTLTLMALEQEGIPIDISLCGGSMEIRFGDPVSFEGLAEDWLRFNGVLRNFQYGTRSSGQPSLETAIYLERLVCSNGAIAQRRLASAKLMRWATQEDVSRLVRSRVVNPKQFHERVRGATLAMAESMPSQAEHDALLKRLQREVGIEQAERLLGAAVSWYDHWNALTAGATHFVENLERRRRLQIEAGGMLERFLK